MSLGHSSHEGKAGPRPAESGRLHSVTSKAMTHESWQDSSDLQDKNYLLLPIEVPLWYHVDKR